MNGKGLWWLSGLCGQTNNFQGKVYDYQPVWGTGAALISLTPTFTPIDTTDNINQDNLDPQVKPSNQIFSSRAPEPVGAYAHAKKVGNLLFLAGIGPRERGTKTIPGVTLDKQGKIIDYDIEIQTRSVIENVKIILEDSGSSFEKIIDVQVFLTDMEKDFKKFNEVYKEYFSKTQPTRTTVSITALPTPIAVEFKIIAEA
ncbi:MAG: hypothetical protein H7263_04790 [Candidatus Sericytochromatia bacterium]|nr:hypothetical protein [Candidatus Sericytochromatia bacterium]